MKANPPREARELERLRFWHGQTVRSADFRTQLEMDEQRRWWHVRAMHNAFGIAAGYEVRIVAGNARVFPGIAYDWFGREVLLVREQEIAIPHQAKEITLLARYRNSDGAPAPNKAETIVIVRDAECAGSVVLVWKATADVGLEDGVPLTSVLAGKARSTQSRSRPVSRPRILAGATPAYASGWEEWRPLQVMGQLIGVQVTVDFSAAGFLSAPCCFTTLQRTAEPDDEDEIIEALWSGASALQTNGFVFQALFGGLTNEDVNILQFLRRKGFFVSWLAMEESAAAVAEHGQLAKVNL